MVIPYTEISIMIYIYMCIFQDRLFLEKECSRVKLKMKYLTKNNQLSETDNNSMDPGIQLVILKFNNQGIT